MSNDTERGLKVFDAGMIWRGDLSEGFISHTFDVSDRPRVLKAINLPCDAIVKIEMGFEADCEIFWGPYAPNCEQASITACNNIIALIAPGLYRVVVEAPEDTDLSDVRIVYTTAPSSADLSQYQGGSEMGCGSQVNVTKDPETGCVTIVVDNEATTICPGNSAGSVVACSEGNGILIDGELCEFPEQITVQDVANALCGDEALRAQMKACLGDIRLQAVARNGDEVILTMSDGSQLRFDAPLDTSVVPGTYSVDSDGVAEVPLENGAVFRINLSSLITAPVDNEDRYLTAVDTGTPDVFIFRDNLGNIIDSVDMTDYLGGDVNNNLDSVTTNGTDVIHTMLNGDEYILPLGFLNETLTDNGDCTYTFLDGSGGSTVIDTRAAALCYDDTNWFLAQDAPTVGDALDQLSDFLAAAFGDNLIILNNPTFYIRQATGSANPPIETQADLTEANAFDSFANLWSFISRAYILGTVTIDARGTFDAAQDQLVITSNRTKNAALVTVQGDPADEEALVFRSGFQDSTNNISFTGGVSGRIRDVTFEMGPAITRPDGGVFSALHASAGASVNIRGAIRLKGNPGASAVEAIPFYASGTGSTMVFGTAAAADCRVFIDLSGNKQLNALFGANSGGRIILYVSRFNVLNDVPLTVGIASIRNSSSLVTSTAYQSGLAYERPTFVGPGRFITPRTISLLALSIYEHYGSRWPTNAIDYWSTQAYTRTNVDPVIRIDKASYFTGRYGLDVLTDPRFTVV